jgi:hypothetical protein
VAEEAGKLIVLIRVIMGDQAEVVVTEGKVHLQLVREGLEIRQVFLPLKVITEELVQMVAPTFMLEEVVAAQVHQAYLPQLAPQPLETAEMAVLLIYQAHP